MLRVFKMQYKDSKCLCYAILHVCLKTITALFDMLINFHFNIFVYFMVILLELTLYEDLTLLCYDSNLDSI